MNWKIGDVVLLKSGSDRMTVVEITKESVVCMWFRMSDHTFQHASIHQDALVEFSRAR